MPNEFDDLSDDVAKGSEKVKRGLQEIKAAAEEADSAQSKLSDTQKRAIGIAGAYASGISQMAGSVSGLGRSSVTAARGIDAINKITQKAGKAVSRLSGDVNTVSSSLSDVKDASGQAGKAFDGASQSADGFSRSQNALNNSASSLRGEIKEQAGALDVLKSKFGEGQSAAEGFAGGIGVSNGALIGIGVAVVYAAKQLATLSGQFQGAATGLASYNNSVALAGARTGEFAGGGLEELRKGLGLTRDQALAFSDVVETATNELGLSADKVSALATSIQGAFGGDPTEKLKEYVDVLKEIPTLETDLSITASLDSSTDALFGLAQSGKIGVVVDMQSAGVLGDVNNTVIAESDKQLLDASNRSAAAIESVEDLLINKLYPKWGPKLDAGVQIAEKLVAGIGSVVAGIGASNAFLGFQQKATTAAVGLNTRSITSAIMARGVGGRTGGRGRGGRGGGLGTRGSKGVAGIKGFLVGSFKSIKVQMAGFFASASKVLTAFKKGGMQAGFKSITRSIDPARAKAMTRTGKDFTPRFMKFVTKFGRGVVAASAGLGILSVLSQKAGGSLDNLEDKLEVEGKQIAAGLAGMGSGVAKLAGTVAAFATLGSIIPGVGTAIGAVVGLMVGVVPSLSDLGKGIASVGRGLQETVPVMDGLGQDVQKYRSGVQLLGRLNEKLGSSLESFGDMWRDGVDIIGKDFKRLGKAAVDSAKDISFSANIAYGSLIRTQEYTKILARSGKLAEEMNANFDRLSKNSKKLAKVNAENREKLIKSAQGLQKQLNKTENEFASAKFAFADLQKEVSGLSLKNLENVGFTAGKFQLAIADASEASIRKYEKVGDSLDTRRREILADSSLTAKDRRAALTQLNQQELKATEEFVGSMGELVSAILEAPDTILAGLKTELGIKELQFDVEAGVVPLSEMESAVSAVSDNLLDMFEKSGKDAQKAKKVAEDTRKTLVERQEEARDQILESYKDLPDKVKENLKEIAGIDLSVESNLDEIINSDNFEEALASMREGLESMNDAVEKTRDGIVSTDFNEVANSVKSATEEQKTLKREIEGLQKASSDIKVDKGSAEEQAEALRNKETIENEIKEKQAKATEIAKKQADLQSKLASTISSVNEGRISEQAAQAQAIAIINAIATGADATASGVAEAYAKNKDINTTLDSWNDAVKESVKKSKDLQGLQEAADTQRDVVSVVEELAKTKGDVISAEKTIADLEAKRIDDANKLYTDLSASLANFDNTEEIAKAQKAEKGAMLQAQTARMLGDGIGATADAINKSTGVAESVVEGNVARIQGIEKAISAARAKAEQIAKAGDAEGANTLNAVATKLEKNLAEAKQTLMTSLQGFGLVGDAISQQFDELAKSLSMQRVGADMDLTGALFEGAEFSSVLENEASRSIEAFKSAAAERRRLEEASLKASIEIERKRIAAKVKALRAEGRNDEADDLEASEGSILAAKEQTKQAEIETQYKKDVVEIAQKEADLAERRLTDEQARTDTAMELVRAFDGSAGALGRVFDKSIQIERDRLGVLQNQLAQARAADANSVVTRELETKVLQQQAKIRMEELNIIKEMAAARREEIDISQDLIEDQLSFVSEMGGSFESIISLQQQSVALEREKLKVAEEELANARAAGVTGTELLRLESAAAKQSLALKRKEIGVQKDIVEKILGAAFGEIRGSVGARRQRGSVQGLLGVDRTRAMTETGAFARTNGARVLTKDEAIASRQFGRGGFGSGGGVGNEFGRGVGLTRQGQGANTEIDRTVGRQGGASGGSNVTTGGVNEGRFGPDKAEMPTMKVTGELTVKFDNAMFKQQVAQVVGEVINTAELVKELKDKYGVITK